MTNNKNKQLYLHEMHHPKIINKTLVCLQIRWKVKKSNQRYVKAITTSFLVNMKSHIWDANQTCYDILPGVARAKQCNLRTCITYCQLFHPWCLQHLLQWNRIQQACPARCLRRSWTHHYWRSLLWHLSLTLPLRTRKMPSTTSLEATTLVPPSHSHSISISLIYFFNFWSNFLFPPSFFPSPYSYSISSMLVLWDLTWHCQRRSRQQQDH